MSDANDPPSDSNRLADLIHRKEVIVFEKDAEDRDYPYIKLTIWGAIPTNELFVRLSNGVTEFTSCTPSPLVRPPMQDRKFGIDVSDHTAAINLAEQLWEKHRAELILEGR